MSSKHFPQALALNVSAIPVSQRTGTFSKAGKSCDRRFDRRSQLSGQDLSGPLLSCTHPIRMVEVHKSPVENMSIVDRNTAVRNRLNQRQDAFLSAAIRHCIKEVLCGVHFISIHEVKRSVEDIAVRLNLRDEDHHLVGECDLILRCVVLSQTVQRKPSESYDFATQRLQLSKSSIESQSISPQRECQHILMPTIAFCVAQSHLSDGKIGGKDRSQAADERLIAINPGLYGNYLSIRDAGYKYHHTSNNSECREKWRNRGLFEVVVASEHDGLNRANVIRRKVYGGLQ